MYRKSKVILSGVVGVALFLTACAPNSDKKASPAEPQVPTNLTFNKPAIGEKLTKSQVEQIKAAFAQKSSMILPPGELIFRPKDMTPEMQAQKEAYLKSIDVNSYDLLKMIQSGCVKDRPTMHVDATFPIDGEDTKKSLRAGDHMTVNTNGGLAGANCPVEAAGTYSVGAQVDERNLEANSGRASGEVTAKLKGLVSNPRFAALLGSRGLIVQSSMSGLVMSREVSAEPGKSRTMLRMELNGSYLSLKQDIPFSASSQTLSNENGGVELIIASRLQMQGFSFNLDIHSVQPALNTATTQETYINGNLMTPAEMSELFGKNGPDHVAGKISSSLK